MTPSPPNGWRQLAENISFETQAFIRGEYCQVIGKNVFRKRKIRPYPPMAGFSTGNDRHKTTL